MPDAVLAIDAGTTRVRALLGGLTRGATKAHVARAAMEGIAFRVRELLDRIYEDSGLPRPSILAADGGASKALTLSWAATR